MVKNIIYAIIGIILYEACLLPIYLWLGPALFSIPPEKVFGCNPCILMLVIPFSIAFLVGVFILVKRRGLRIFLILYVIYEIVNYSFIFGVFVPEPADILPTMSDAEKARAAIQSILPMFYYLIPFGIVYWGAVIVALIIRRKKQTAPPSPQE